MLTIALLTTSNGIALAQQTIDNSPPATETINNSVPADFPESLANDLLADAARVSGLPVSALQITTARRQIWPDGCLGIYLPNQVCTMALVSGWVVSIGSQQQQWIYHTGEFGGGRLAGDPLPLGLSQATPILPTIVEPNQFVFRGVPTGRWFDPPTTYGFEYQMLSDSLFTKILDFPVGIDADNRFAISVQNLFLGEFGPGQPVDFVTLLGKGVSGFTLTGIDPLVDASNPMAFPLKLAFNTETADFQMRAIDKPSPISGGGAAVPEPSSIIGILVAGALGAATRAKRKYQAEK